jgi:hypothetical protein
MPYCRPCITIAMTALLLTCTPVSFAYVGDPEYCSEPKSLQETAQDETRTRSERCAWRDDSLGPGAARDMTLAQTEPPAAKIDSTAGHQRIAGDRGWSTLGPLHL